MLENDLLLGTFALKKLREMNDFHLDQYEKLLLQPDQEIFQWIAKNVEPPPEHNNEILRELREHVNSDPMKEQREFDQK